MKKTCKTRLEVLEAIIIDMDRVMDGKSITDLCHRIAFNRKVKAVRLANRVHAKMIGLKNL